MTNLHRIRRHVRRLTKTTSSSLIENAARTRPSTSKLRNVSSTCLGRSAARFRRLTTTPSVRTRNWHAFGTVSLPDMRMS